MLVKSPLLMFIPFSPKSSKLLSVFSIILLQILFASYVLIWIKEISPLSLYTISINSLYISSLLARSLMLEFIAFFATLSKESLEVLIKVLLIIEK